MKFFEDIGVGEISDIGRHTFTAEDIKAFATRFDPQPFHLDEALAARSQFGRLCASGWHTACVLDATADRLPPAGGRGTPRTRRSRRPARAFAWISRSQVAQTGLCRRHDLVCN